jgi:hypothetical protein
MAMDQMLSEWQRAVDRFSQSSAPDYSEMARLVGAMAASEETLLRQAATQALPSLRGASAPSADKTMQEAARRRVGIIRDVLHSLSVPRFGKRGEVLRPLTPEERHRELLRLPLGRKLARAEINQAYKRAAKILHPDGGGDAQSFCELAAARDALLQPGRSNGG